MPDRLPDIQHYRDQMDSFLRQLKNELDAQGRAISTPVSSQDSLDEYLLELNTFYYESFHRKFFPLYSQTINNDIRNLLHIGQQEEILKQDILANLKQHARLFNQVKNIAATLERKRQELQTIWFKNQRGTDERSVNLLFIIKECAGSCNSFLSVVRNLQILLEDQKLMTALNQHPAHAMAANLIGDWEPENSKAVRDFNRLLAGWQLAAKLLIKFQENPAPDKEALELLIQELDKIDSNWDNRKVPSTIRKWYQQYIQPNFRLYLESISLGSEKRNHRHTGQTAARFAAWLNSLLIVIEQSMTYRSRVGPHVINQLSLLIKTDKDYMKELDVYISRVLHSIEELILSLSSSTQASYDNHSKRMGGLLTVIDEYLKQQLDRSLMSRGVLLATDIGQFINQINYLESRIELLDEQEEHYIYASGQYRAIIGSLDSYLKLLRDSREDLNRMLTPYYIQKSFQGLELSIEHVTITEGSILPAQYYYLMNEMAIDTETDAPTGRILHEEGDIFIIRLNELTETEIPKIIIAKKG